MERGKAGTSDVAQALRGCLAEGEREADGDTPSICELAALRLPLPAYRFVS
jgi:hypothetical protein